MPRLMICTVGLFGREFSDTHTYIVCVWVVGGLKRLNNIGAFVLVFWDFVAHVCCSSNFLCPRILGETLFQMSVFARLPPVHAL